MKRKLILLTMIVALCLSLASFASAKDQAYVVDEFGVLTDTELEELNALAQTVYEETQVGVYFVFTNLEDLDEYDVDSLTGGMENYFVMVENDEVWTTYSAGRGLEITDSDEEYLRDVYDAADTYYEGISDYMDIAWEYFVVPADTPQGDILEAAEPHTLYDFADILSGEQKLQLAERLESMTDDKIGYAIAIYPNVEGSLEDFSESLYYGWGLGCGENKNCVLLVMDMGSRQYVILSMGKDVSAVAQVQDDIIEHMKPQLKQSDYAGAFNLFLDECEEALDDSFDWGGNLLLAAAIGLVVGLIVVLILKGQLKSVRRQSAANVYVKPGSMDVTVRDDYFRYRTVTRIRKPSSNNSGSGSGSSPKVSSGSF